MGTMEGEAMTADELAKEAAHSFGLVKEEWLDEFARLETTEWGGRTDDYMRCVSKVNGRAA